MIGIIIFASFLLRLIGLNQSLWLDEGVTARVVHQYSLTGIIANFSPADFHPPLYYLFMKLWTALFGFSEVSLRFPSVLFSLASGYIIYLIGRELKNKAAGLWAMSFFLFNPLIIYYSQEARMYSLTIFFITLATFFLLKKKIRLFPLIIFSALGFLTFYGSLFYLLGIGVYLFFFKNKKLSFFYLVGVAALSLAVLPLIVSQFFHSRQALRTVVNWSLVLGTANIKNMVLLPVKFATGRISFQPKILYYFFGLATAIISFFPLVFPPRKRRPLLVLIFVPLLSAFLVSFKIPLFSYFRLLYLLVPISLFIGFSLSERRYWRRLVLTGFIVWSLVYLFIPQFHREDWKKLADYLPKRSVVYGLPSSLDGLRYYRQDIKIVDIRDKNRRQTDSLNRDYYVIPYTFSIYGISESGRCLFGEKGEERDFRGHLRLIYCRR